MIVDCHTHVWQNAAQLGEISLGEMSADDRRTAMRNSISGQTSRLIAPGDVDLHRQHVASVDKAIVLGFRSKYLGAQVPNDYVAKYVKADPDRLIGFAGIDPTEPGALDDLIVAREELKLRGLAISPSGQDFHPTDTRAMRIYEQAAKHKMPLVFHPGGLLNVQSKLEYARPFLIDEIARSFPDLRIIIAQLGQPWIDECIVLIGKHANVYADISGLMIRQWPAYNALVAAFQYGVIDKLLFGSDFPYSDPADCIENLYSINQLVQGTNLPLVPREALRGILERDALDLLGLGA
ncbi:MAG TPA: amidohydrolase family protein [Tepidisphaeraceae bacterium]|nr:amidohydrolase family protein [Tepidisphaeraceae bacterium]